MSRSPVKLQASRWLRILSGFENPDTCYSSFSLPLPPVSSPNFEPQPAGNNCLTQPANKCPDTNPLGTRTFFKPNHLPTSSCIENQLIASDQVREIPPVTQGRKSSRRKTLKRNPHTTTQQQTVVVECSIVIYEEGQIVAASFHILIKKLTELDDPIDMDEFLLSYRHVCSPAALFETLKQRFMCTPTDARDVHLRIFNFLRHWILHYWFDFNQEDSLINSIHTFLRTIRSTSQRVCATVADAIQRKLEEQLDIQDRPKSKIFIVGEVPPSIIDPYYSAQPLQFDNSLEIARQMMLRTWDIWVSIDTCEFLSWQKQDLKKTPNILKMKSQSRCFSAWISSLIVSCGDLTERTKIIKKFLDISVHLRLMGHFHGIMEIWNALQRPAVARMKTTFGRVFRTQKYQILWTELKNLVNPNGRYQNLTNAIHITNPPVIPYLEIYLKDLLKYEALPSTIEGGLINYSKCRLIANSIKEAQLYQQRSGTPAFQKVDFMLTKLDTLPYLKLDLEMFSLSCQNEPMIQEKRIALIPKQDNQHLILTIKKAKNLNISSTSEVSCSAGFIDQKEGKDIFDRNESPSSYGPNPCWNFAMIYHVNETSPQLLIIQVNQVAQPIGQVVIDLKSKKPGSTHTFSLEGCEYAEEKSYGQVKIKWDFSPCPPICPLVNNTGTTRRRTKRRLPLPQS